MELLEDIIVQKLFIESPANYLNALLVNFYEYFLVPLSKEKSRQKITCFSFILKP